MSAEASSSPRPTKKPRLTGPTSGSMAADESKTSSSSWVKYAADNEFPIQNIPFGVCKPTADAAPRICTRIGDTVVDVKALVEAGLFDAAYTDMLSQTTLNKFMGAGRAVSRAVRSRLIELLSADCAEVRDNEALRAKATYGIDAVTMLLPFTIGDYTDFYSSREHATNVGTMFRGKDNALQPNWLHLPVGYHGRASSVVIDGTEVRRPCGQLQKNATNAKEGSVYGPCKLLDFELEMGTVVGKGNAMGEALDVKKAKESIFGFVLMNDWSARDIQKFEYVPLGPFTAKNFATTVSPWVVTADALEPFRCPTSAVKQTDPVPLPYLRDPDYSSYDINLFVDIDDGEGVYTVTRSSFKYLYWTPEQQLAHHTVTGCPMAAGDLLGSGTISGTERGAFGSMLELSWKGSMTVDLGDSGKTRKFLKDGDTVVVRGYCQGDGYRVGFGKASGKILPAKPYKAADE